MDPNTLLSQLTLSEKIRLLAGSSFWTTTPIPRLNIPSLKLSDGPNGARGASFNDSYITSACFPSSVSLAATFSRDLASQIGKALGEETLTKGANVLLGPTVCPHRDPRGGRNFESFSEDPYLAGELASAYITGVQGQGVGATIKHYACNEQETRRFTIDVRVSERALREIYLKPFEIAVRAAKPWAVMTSFNSVNGEHADSNGHLLAVLRGWGFDGLVMSDWGGVNSVAPALNAGLDLEMPGPPNKYTLEKVSEALQSGDVTEETVDKRVGALLRLLERTGKFSNPEITQERAVDSLEHRRLIRQAGAEGIVLLKNANGILPLQVDKQNVKSIALLGLAKEYLGHGGGSAKVNSHHRITPYAALQEAVGDSVELRYAEGAKAIRNLPVMSASAELVNEDGHPGWTLQVWRASSDIPSRTNIATADFQSNHVADATAATITATFTPTITGNHYLGFSTVGNTRVFINDELIFQYEGNYPDVMAFLLGTATEEKKQYIFLAGQSYKIRIEADSAQDTTSGLETYALNVVGAMLTFMHEHEHDADLLSEARDVARSSDMAIVFVGHLPSWECEGADRDSMDLPCNGSQDQLIAATAAVNPRTIVVNSTGSPITMPWLSDVAAVLQAWFPGQEAGYAIADVLLGKTTPGKLPVTFPKSVTVSPSYGNFPGEVGRLQVSYEEDVFIGYRHFDREYQAGVSFPFGFGLSYTTFDICNARVSPNALTERDDDRVTVTVDIKNTGPVAGSEVVQVYVGAVTPLSSIERPVKQLAGFEKVWLQPEETKQIFISVGRESAVHWDDAQDMWAVDAGVYQIHVGSSSADIACTLDFIVEKAFSYGP